MLIIIERFVNVWPFDHVHILCDACRKAASLARVRGGPWKDTWFASDVIDTGFRLKDMHEPVFNTLNHFPRTKR